VEKGLIRWFVFNAVAVVVAVVVETILSVFFSPSKLSVIVSQSNIIYLSSFALG